MFYEKLGAEALQHELLRHGVQPVPPAARRRRVVAEPQFRIRRRAAIGLAALAVATPLMSGCAPQQPDVIDPPVIEPESTPSGVGSGAEFDDSFAIEPTPEVEHPKPVGLEDEPGDGQYPIQFEGLRPGVVVE